MLAIVADPVDKCRKVHRDAELEFPILSDPQARVIRSFGVLHEKGLFGGPIALPANFLIDESGRIVWARTAGRVPNRPDPAMLLERVRGLTES